MTEPCDDRTPEERAEAGDAAAQAELGDICMDRGDAEAAFRWYSESAEQGNPDGLFGLATCYYDGIGTEMDRDRAVSLFRKASIKGSKDAGRKIIGLLVDGELGTAPDPDRFKEYFEKASRGDTESMNLVGMCYEYGLGTRKYLGKAIHWYQEAALCGSLEGLCNLNSVCSLTGCTRDDLEEIGHNPRFSKE